MNWYTCPYCRLPYTPHEVKVCPMCGGPGKDDRPRLYAEQQSGYYQHYDQPHQMGAPLPLMEHTYKGVPLSQLTYEQAVEAVETARNTFWMRPDCFVNWRV